MTASPTAPPEVAGVPRRSFLKWSGAVGGGAALVGTAAHFGLMPGVGPANAATAGSSESTFAWSSCNVNCGSRCPLRMEVKDGTIVRVLPDNTGNDELGSQQIRACVRGRAIRQRIYNPDRLKTPMRRKPGTKRGAGEWEEISWEEAYEEVANKLTSTIETYGNEAIFYHYGSGATGSNITNATWPRLLSILGGYLGYYGTYSTAQIRSATPYTYGSYVSSNTFDDVENSKLLVLWGNNPLETRMSGGGETFVLQQTLRRSNVRTIVIDPRYSDTAVDVADEWIPIRPGTDTALSAAMAYTLITEDLVDQKFLDTYCVGYDEDHMPEGVPAGNSYKSYILGEGPDGTPKTPEWAAPITGIPAETIVRLARDIGTAKPCAIIQGWGPQRQANGENQSRAIFMLAILTGNVGITGGGTGAREGSYRLPVAGLPAPENPVSTMIPVFMWTDAIERGPEMTATADGIQGKDKLDVPIKLIVNYAGNTLLNQHSDANRTVKLLEDDTKCEYIVVIDNHMTPSARYADLLIPDAMNAEQPDLIPGGYAGDLGYVILTEQVMPPLYECKTSYEVCTEIARRLGVEDEFTEGRTLEEWVDYLVTETRAKVPDLPDLEEVRVFRQANPDGHAIALKDFRDDPVANPLETPSGKIEIFSKDLWEMSQKWTLPEGDRLTALPEHVATWEGAEEAKVNEKYPLQMIGHHYKARTHSSYANSEWLREAHPQMAWINTQDADERGIRSGDTVEVFNDRGRTRLAAYVTAKIAPGVISIPQGAWYTPTADGVDAGGCVNTLTSWRPSPLAKGNPQHTNLVQIEKA